MSNHNSLKRWQGLKAGNSRKLNGGVFYETVKVYRPRYLAILKQNETGTPVVDLCRGYGMSDAVFHKWCVKYGGMGISLMKRMKESGDENRRLKRGMLKKSSRLKSPGGYMTHAWCGKARPGQ